MSDAFIEMDAELRVIRHPVLDRMDVLARDLFMAETRVKEEMIAEILAADPELAERAKTALARRLMDA